MKPLRVVIVHQGEDLPSDDGYEPLRYGRLALALREHGAHVTRISPSFSHFRRAQHLEPCTTSDEGDHVVVPTVGYGASISKDRAIFTRQLIAGASAYVREHRSDIDVVVAGMPPSGLVTALRRAGGSELAIIADIRDLWPDALAVGDRKKLAPLFELFGRAFSQEVRQANAVTAVTDVMRDWAPASMSAETIPIGMRIRHVDDSKRPGADVGLRAGFISNHTHGFDFDVLLEGWRQFAEPLHGQHDEPRFAFIGATPTTSRAQSLLDKEPTIESLGTIAPAEVANTLGGFDIGVSPSTPEWEYSLGNKIFDYLSVGQFVLHSLEASTSAALDNASLGQHVERTADAWRDAFREAHDRRAQLRAERARRIEVADELFGQSATSGRFIELMESLVR